MNTDRSTSVKAKEFVFILSAMLLVALLFFLLRPIPPLTPKTSGTAYNRTSSVYSPPLIGNRLNITYPNDYAKLANYTLDLINSDRRNFGLEPVSLSMVPSGQQHADSMLYFGYFSHWDTQGFKPYMRYTLLGGRGSVSENVAYEYWSKPHYTSLAEVEQGIKELESMMVYNDSICCNNGHRYNILNPLHNKVSIGIAYNSTHLYLVEDFENYYVNASIKLEDNLVTLYGNIVNPIQRFTSLIVYYDAKPEAMNITQLKALRHEYTPGIFVGGILPQCFFICEKFENGTTVYAQEWVVDSYHVSISFTLQPLTQKFGPGVYTLYLTTNSSVSGSVTSFSLFLYN